MRREAVRDDVVQVAGDAQPFLGHEPARLLLAGLLEVAGPLLESEQVLAAGAGGVAEEPGRDAPSVKYTAWNQPDESSPSAVTTPTAVMRSDEASTTGIQRRRS